MTDQHFFDMTSMSYELHALRRELDSFRSGEAYVKLREDYENIIHSQNQTIKKLRMERDEISFTRKQITNQWQEVLDDMEKEHAKEIKRLNRLIVELLDIIASLKKINAKLDEKRKKALSDYYDTATKLEDAQGMLTKLTAQVNHNYENSSLPSSKCIGRKKITNNRVPTGKNRAHSLGMNIIPEKPCIRTEPSILNRKINLRIQQDICRQATMSQNSP